MKRLVPNRIPAATLVAAAIALLAPRPAAAIIDSLFGCRPSPSGPLFLHAGKSTTVTVKGGGTDLVQRVSETGLTGVHIRIGDRKHGIGSSVNLEVRVEPGIRHGDEGRIRLHYPIGEDSFPVKLVGRSTVRSMSVEGVTPVDGRHVLDLNRDYVLVLRGSNLDILDPDDKLDASGGTVSLALVSRSEAEVRLRMRASAKRGYTIEPDDVRESKCSAPNIEGSTTLRLFFGFDPADTPAAGGGTPGSGSSSGSGRPPVVSSPSNPNLLPVRLFPERPLLRKINSLPSVMVPIALCGNLRNDEEGVRQIPAFEWGVSNTNVADVTTAFQVQLVNGATGAVLATETLPSLARGQSRTFSNWPGRPASVRLVRVVESRLSEYDNSPGCYVVKSEASRVVLDPRPILIRVDPTGAVGEGDRTRELDNDLRIN